MGNPGYDLFKMAESAEIRNAALSDLALLTRVVAHKAAYFPSKWARYDLATPASLQLLPSDTWAAYLQEEYEKMQAMLFGKPPVWDEIMAGLRSLLVIIRNHA